MGDAGRNIKGVRDAVHTLVDRNRFSMAQSKITVSTVGPSPEAFHELSALPASIAW
jgi:23S rRNA (adenine2503-C2)-methyltransferase